MSQSRSSTTTPNVEAGQTSRSATAMHCGKGSVVQSFSSRSVVALSSYQAAGSLVQPSMKFSIPRASRVGSGRH